MQASNRSKLVKLTLMALFAAIAAVLMNFEFPVPFIPPFLKIDLSGVAVLIAAFMFGPWQALAVLLIKDLAHVPPSTSAGVGELADFIMLGAFAVTASLIYRRRKDRKHAIIGCAAATLAIGLVGVIANRFLIIPFYSNIMPIDAILEMCAAVNPAIGSLDAYYWFAAFPFNIFKGILLSAITILCYKKLSVFLKKAHAQEDLR
jgi:riboflavin transporter FmnP